MRTLLSMKVLVILRNLAFLLTGMVMLLLCVGVLSGSGIWLGRAIWAGVAGILMACVLVSLCVLAGRKRSAMLWDELSRLELARSQRAGYLLLTCLLFPVFGLALWLGLVSGVQAFAATGLTGAGLQLIYFSVLDLRGR